jgi:hypothetical protein
MTSTQELNDYLKTVDFPARRDEIVQAARKLSAPEGVIAALQAMPPVEYGNKDEVHRSAHTAIG